MTTLAHLKALLQAATPGPWTTTTHTIWSKNEDTVVANSSREAKLIAAAVNSLGALIAVAEAAEEYVESGHDIVCATSNTNPRPCDCGYDKLHAALAALDAATGKETT